MSDTGSEFALLMARLFVDTVKGSSSILKEILIISYQSKAAKQQMLLSSNNLEKMTKTKTLENLDTVVIEKNSLAEFEKIAKSKDFSYSALKLGESNVAIAYDKDEIEQLNEVLKDLEKSKIKDLSEEKEGVRKKIAKEKNDKSEEPHRNNVSKNKEKDMEVGR